MPPIDVTPDTIHQKLSVLSAGDQLALHPGKYNKPVVLNGVTGTHNNPVHILPAPSADGKKAVFTSDMHAIDARRSLNEEADRRQKAGNYPAVGHLGDQAMLILRNCQYVVIHGLEFRDCWPTAIYLDNSQNIAVDKVDFRGGTIAIGANGGTTRDIIVQDCRWQQDTTATHDMWNHIIWGRIHGAGNNSQRKGVDIKGDYRHWDGDFFRAWDIAGNVIIRRNVVCDAFNGIHFFNRVDRLPPAFLSYKTEFNETRRSAANVLIEDNDFIRIRDNVFEPEDFAWNWVIRHNRLQDCFRPFSFELERAGWFYIYGNTGSFVNRPLKELRPPEDKEIFLSTEFRRSFSLFKAKGGQANEGPIYAMFNSWYYRKGKGLFPRYAIGNFVHANNAIQFAEPEKAMMFGKLGHVAGPTSSATVAEEAEETERFTRRWDHFDIAIDGDLANDNLYPDHYRSVGYALGARSMHGNPAFADVEGSEFEDPFSQRPKAGDFTITAKLKSFLGVRILLHRPGVDPFLLPAPKKPGAVQDPESYQLLDSLFDFLPRDNWLTATSIRLPLA